MTYCEGHQTLYNQGTAFVTTIKELMQLLLEYRAVVHDSDIRDCMMCCTVNLLASSSPPLFHTSSGLLMFQYHFVEQHEGYLVCVWPASQVQTVRLSEIRHERSTSNSGKVDL